MHAAFFTNHHGHIDIAFIFEVHSALQLYLRLLSDIGTVQTTPSLRVALQATIAAQGASKEYA